jgi:hypothetical protein
LKRAALAASALVITTTATLGVAGWLLPRWATQQVERALLEAEDTYGVDITVDSLHASWARFPRAAVVADGVRAVPRTAPFDDEALLVLDRVEVAVDLRHLLGERLVVQQLLLDGGALQLRRDEGGDNWSLGDRAGDPSSWVFELDHIEVVDVSVDYLDRAEQLHFALHGLDVEGRGVVDGRALRLNTLAQAAALRLSSAGQPWVSALPLRARLPLVYDKPTGGLHFGETTGTLGALPLALSGDLVPEDAGWRFDLTVDAPDATVGQVLAVVPGVRTEVVQLDQQGSVDASARIVGLLSDDGWPGGEATVVIDGASVGPPNTDVRLEQLDLVARVRRAEGPLDDTHVAVEEVRFVLGGEPFAAEARLAPPLSAPHTDGWARGQLDLGLLAQVVPLNEELSGTVDLDVSGRAVGSSMVDARGRVSGRGLRWGTGDDALHVDAVAAELADDVLRLDALELRTGATDLRASGTLRDVLAWWTDDGVLSGELSLDAERLDLRSGEGEGDDGGSGTLTVPDDLDLTVVASARELLTDELALYDVRADARLERGVARLRQAQGSALGGRIALSGTYATNEGAPFGLDGTATLDDLRLASLMEQVGVLQRLVPVAERAGGRVSGDLNVSTEVLADGTVVMESLAGSGAVRLAKGSSLTPPILEEAARRLGLARLAQVDLDDARLAFTIDDGRLAVDPAAVALGPFDATFGGSVGVVDQTLDLGFELDVPAGRLARAQGLNLPIDVGTVDLMIGVVGTYESPRLQIRGGDATEAVVDELTDRAVDEVTDRVNQALADALAEAERQGDALIREAEAAAEKVKAQAAVEAKTLRREARQQADRLVNQANGPVAKAAARVAADEALKVANRAANQVEREAARQADRLVDEARDRKDQLLAEARRTAG